MYLYIHWSWLLYIAHPPQNVNAIIILLQFIYLPVMTRILGIYYLYYLPAGINGISVLSSYSYLLITYVLYRNNMRQ